MDLTISPADWGDPRLPAFLIDHLRDMEPTAPPESRHALDVSGLRADGVRVWVGHLDDALAGTVALAPLSPGHEELKSMRTAPDLRGHGVASALLRHALADARKRGLSRVSLETGSMDFFAAARALYGRHGFGPCPPFGSYRDDPNSVFLTLDLRDRVDRGRSERSGPG